MNKGNTTGTSDHTDKYEQNQRLYVELQERGLHVQPVTVDGDPNRIDQLVVSYDWPPEVEIMTLDQAVAVIVERANMGVTLVGQPERKITFPRDDDLTPPDSV